MTGFSGSDRSVSSSAGERLGCSDIIGGIGGFTVGSCIHVVHKLSAGRTSRDIHLINGG